MYELFFFFFASGDRIQKCFDPKELQIKMSSLLNVSNDASGRPEEFSLMNIEVFVDSEEQNWFKRAHMGKFLGIENIRTSLNDLEKCEILTRQELVPTRRWSGPKNQQNKTDKFLYVFAVEKVTLIGGN